MENVNPGPRVNLDNGESSAGTAERIVGPWWYHVGLGASLTFAFVSMSLRFAGFGVPIALLVALALNRARRRATGVSRDRYTATPGSRRLSGVFGLIFVGLAALGMYLEWGAGVRFAIAGAGVLIGVGTIVMGYRVDDAVRRELRTAR
ncbi:hypothetical protein HNP84_009056 [Thermocatellispora tengchongensis]|uniref:Uncharacterized protein n=1 Tax=Thermocatellispora tengchongensis TaxID=1073253 RepID=A0A840PMQ2_9ACTN|nr:hypothetical protein [Thermocatellispora tengchongensis]MBB5139293.1 hypothetical protein [Thermocatellispora tengchongensis]